MHDNNAFPIMFMPRIHEQKLRAVFLVVQIIHHPYLGRAALCPGVVDGELGGLGVLRYARVAGLAAYVGVFALRGGERLVRGGIDVGLAEGAVEGPGWVGWGFVEGLGEEEDAGAGQYASLNGREEGK